MSTHTCCICQSNTLLDRQNLYTLAVLAGALDVVLRQYGARLNEKPPNNTPWAPLGALVEVLSEILPLLAEGQEQGRALAANIEQYWLGDFDSLCLNCGFMLVEGASSS